MEFVYLAILIIITVIILAWLFKAKARENNVLLDTATSVNKVSTNIDDSPSDSNPVLIQANMVNKLSDRNQDVIQKYLSEIYQANRYNYIEDKVYGCIYEIAEKEGRADLIPKIDETLSDWRERSDIPHEYLDLESYLSNLFSEKHSNILKDQKVKRIQRLQEKKSEKEMMNVSNKIHKGFYNRNYDLVAKFLDIAERKVSIIDDYGDENWDALSEEIDICLNKISQKEKDQIDWRYYKKNNSGLPDKYEWLKNELRSDFLDYHAQVARKESSINNIHKMSGVEFESWVIKILKENGFNDLRGTPATGDQGADIITERNGKKIIIQAKRHKGTIGNRAVQEVISAVQYYRGDEGWVITNSTFTSSAKALAQRSKIKLIDGKALSHFKDYI